MENKKRVELLAPAGNMDSFIAACNAGADAIYMGLGKHNARVMAKNFTEEEYIKAIDYAHLRGIKVYLTLNTLMYDDEIKEALEMVVNLYSYGLDAVILQDIGVANLIHKLLPNLHLHASTQMSAYSLEQVKFLQELGFKRVVLARELTLDEIKYICDNVNVEIEIFIHGALCVSLSGQCMLSSTIGGRSANRGRCAQPCRMKYSLFNSKNKEIIKNSYIISKKDIFGLDIIDSIITSNVASLKIEGRNKTPEYVALVVSKYRKYIDKYYNGANLKVCEEDENELLQMFNRDGLSSGYLKGVSYKKSISLLSPKNTGLYLGKVIDQKKMYVKVKLENNIDLHDGIEIYSDDMIVSNICTCIKDDSGKIINKEAKKGEYVWIGDISKKVKFGSSIYKTSSYKLNKDISKNLVFSNINRRKICLDITIKMNEKIVVRAYDNYKLNFINIVDYIPEESKSKSITKDDIINAFSKTLDTAFEFDIVNLTIDDLLFVPTSKLNEIRRNIISNMEKIYIVRNDIKNINVEEIMKLDVPNSMEITSINAFFVYNYDDKIDYIKEYNAKNNKNLDRLDICIKDFIKYEDSIFNKYINKVKIGIYIPNLVFKNLDKFIKDNLERIVLKGIDTIILSSFSYMELINNIKLKKYINLIADYSFNISNIYTANFMKKLGFNAVVPSYDISISDIEKISSYINIEIVNGYVTVMTSRFCVLGSFVANRDDKKCSMPCIKDKFYLVDSYGYKYYIVCDNLDCVMRLVKLTRNIDVNESNLKNIYCTRDTII